MRVFHAYLVFASCTLAALALLTSRSQAQLPNFGFPIPAPYLLSNKSVQAELKIADDQKKKVAEVVKKLGELMAEKMKDVMRDNLLEKMPGIVKEVNQAALKDLDGVLEKEQVKRLGQIM